MTMDFPESRIVKRELRRRRLDATAALAVLLKTLADDHVDRLPHLEPIDDDADDFDPDDEAHARTPLEMLLFLLDRHSAHNGRLFARHLRPGMRDDEVGGAQIELARDRVRHRDADEPGGLGGGDAVRRVLDR